MSYNTQNQQLAIAFNAQGDLQTANVAGDLWKIAKTNAGLAKVDYQMDSDAADIGKGSEFAQNVYPISKSTSMSLERRLSSEWAAWLFQFGFGNANTQIVGNTYTMTPMDVADGLDMPAMTVVEQLGSVIDRALVGMAVNSFKINFQTGPGRNNTMTTVDLIGCGKTVEPSTLTIPSTPLAEHLLNGHNATVVLNGTTYSGANKSLMSLEASFNNNLRGDSGYFIGSGSDGAYAIKGRMERGNRQYGLNFTARLESGSPELVALKAGTVGTASITIPGAASHSLVLTYPKIQYSAVEISDSDGLAIVSVTVTPMEDSNKIVCQAVVETSIATIG